MTSFPAPAGQGSALRMRLRAAPLAWSALAAGALAIGVYFLLPSHVQSVVFVVLGAASVACVVLGARRNLPPGRRLPWFLFAFGLGGQVCGDAVFAFYEIHRDREPPVVSAADPLYFAGYLALVAGVLLLSRSASASARRAAMLDSLAVFLALTLVAWTRFVDPYAYEGTSRELHHVVGIGYPTMDVFLITAIVLVLVRRRRRSSATWLLIASVLLRVVADEAYGFNTSGYHGGSWVDAMWLAAYVCWAAAALDPSTVRIGAGEANPVSQVNGTRIVLLACSLLVAPAILVFQVVKGRDVHVSIGALGAAIAMVVLVRLGGLIRNVEAARVAEQEARREGEVAQRLLRFQNDQLRELDRLKDEFVAGVSHELRTPLTSISGYVELLREDEESAAKQAYLQIIDRNAARLLGLVSDVLFAARLQDGGLKLSFQPIDVGRLVEQAVEEALPRAREASVRVGVAVDALPPVDAEPSRLSQLLDNLISNAIKFTPAGGTIEVRARAADGLVRIEVSDTGTGIAPEDRERLFDRFFRSQSALEQQVQGTGLGLYISKAIAEAHGGRIGVSSAEGEGTTFVVELPAVT